MNFNRFILLILVGLTFIGCEQKPQTEPKIEQEVQSPYNNATLLIDYGTAFNNDGNPATPGKLLVIQKDGKLKTSPFEEENGGETFGYSCIGTCVKYNKIYIIAKNGVKNTNPELLIINGESLKLEKRYSFKLIIEGIPETPNGIYVATPEKAYIDFFDGVYSFDLINGKLESKINKLSSNGLWTNNPFFEIENKIIHAQSGKIQTIDPLTNSVSETILPFETPRFSMLNKEGNLLVLDKQKLYIIDAKKMTLISSSDLEHEVGETACASQIEPCIYYSGVYMENLDKSIIKFDYRTGKSSVFADLNSTAPFYAMYKIRMNTNPKTGQLIVSVLDYVTSKYTNIYDEQTSQLPAIPIKTYKHNNVQSITEIKINALDLKYSK